jgi:hypothetical protein
LIQKNGAVKHDLPNFGAGDLIDDIAQFGVNECMLLSGAASLGRSNLKRLIWFDGELAVTVRLHRPNEQPVYIRMLKSILYHEKAMHTSWWPFALSGATAKLSFGWQIEQIVTHLDIYTSNEFVHTAKSRQDMTLGLRLFAVGQVNICSGGLSVDEKAWVREICAWPAQHWGRAVETRGLREEPGPGLLPGVLHWFRGLGRRSGRKDVLEPHKT